MYNIHEKYQRVNSKNNTILLTFSISNGVYPIRDEHNLKLLPNLLK